MIIFSVGVGYGNFFHKCRLYPVQKGKFKDGEIESNSKISIYLKLLLNEPHSGDYVVLEGLGEIFL